MAEAVKKPDETAMMATYAAIFLILWYAFVRIARAMVCAMWPVYILAAVGTVKLLQAYKPEEIMDMAQRYYKTAHDFFMNEYNKYVGSKT